ncbi:MAG TPA: hypothetical protein VF753_11650 [Terriglobales bacterium]
MSVGSLRLRTVLFVCLVTIAAWAQFPTEWLVPAKSPTTENLRGISVVSNKVAWASGTHGTYLRTLDGGQDWEAGQVPGAESLDFRDVEAFGPDVAYLLAAGPGEQSRIYKTVDAGKNWALQFTNRDLRGFFDCMAFWDRNRGIAVGDPVSGDHGLNFEVITTNDGGAHWNAVASTALPPAIDGEGAFAASGTCVAVQGKKNVWFATGGKAARVFRSRDGGKTWSVTETPIIHGADSSGIFSIAFRDAKHGVIAGGDYKKPEQAGANLAFTSDGGRTWKLSSVAPQAYFSDVAFYDRHGSVYATGTAMTIQARPGQAIRISTANLNAIGAAAFPIAVGPKGTIMLFDPRLTLH